MVRPPLPDDRDGAGNGELWGDSIRQWLTSLDTDINSVLPLASQSLAGKGGVTSIEAITQAAYTALPVKDPYTLYACIQGDGTIVMRFIGGAVNPTPPANTPSAPGGSVGTITQTTLQLASITVPSSTGGSPITGYRFFAYNPTGTSAATFNPEWVSAVILPANLPTSFTFTNMVAGTAYQIGIYALNANGEGARLRLSTTTDTVPSGGGGGVGGGSGLPAAVSAMWYNRYQRPRFRELPADVKNINNHYVVAAAIAATSGTGTLAFGPANGETATELKDDILALRSAGANVCIGIGSSAGNGITITNSTQVTQAYNSIVSFVTNFGFNGIDIDLEPSSSTWVQASIVSLCQQLKTLYGSSFIIGLTPGLYGVYTANWMALATALGSSYDYMAPMLYDFPEARDSRLNAVSVQKCDIMAAAGIPQSKMILGFMCRPPSDPAYNASTPQVTLDAYKAVKNVYPNIRGAFIWEQYIEGLNSYGWTRLTGKFIRGL
jgi:chitinase